MTKFFKFIAPFLLCLGAASLSSCSCDHTYVIDEGVPATCYSVGLSEGKHCSKCGYVLEAQTILPKTDHNFERSLVEESTCLKEGLAVERCSICGFTKEEIIPLAAHQYVKTTLKAPTCVATGTARYTCSVCGTYYDETMPMVDHQYVSSIVSASTCTVAGVKKYTCSVCGKSYTEALPLAPHVYGSDNHCVNCGQDRLYPYNTITLNAFYSKLVSFVLSEGQITGSGSYIYEPINSDGVRYRVYYEKYDGRGIVFEYDGPFNGTACSIDLSFDTSMNQKHGWVCYGDPGNSATPFGTFNVPSDMARDYSPSRISFLTYSGSSNLKTTLAQTAAFISDKCLSYTNTFVKAALQTCTYCLGFPNYGA